MTRAAADIAEVNRAFYDRLWAGAKLRAPRQFNTWPLLSELAATARDRLEIGPGRLPRLPLEDTHFVDLSTTAVTALRSAGARAETGEITALAFDDAAFDLVCAFDIVEHTADDRRALAEVARVLRPGGTFVFSLPLYMQAWTVFDELVGHYRRYEPRELGDLLASAGFTLERSAAYGMQPSNPWLLRFGVWWLRHFYEHGMRWYHRCFMPLALRLQKPLELVPGMVDDARVDELILVCRRNGD